VLISAGWYQTVTLGEMDKQMQQVKEKLRPWLG
jgi:hypothetical protein